MRHFVVHCRKALLNFSPAQNRSVPPLRRIWAYALARDFPHLTFSLNGQVKCPAHPFQSIVTLRAASIRRIGADCCRCPCFAGQWAALTVMHNIQFGCGSVTLPLVGSALPFCQRRLGAVNHPALGRRLDTDSLPCSGRWRARTRRQLLSSTGLLARQWRASCLAARRGGDPGTCSPTRTGTSSGQPPTLPSAADRCVASVSIWMSQGKFLSSADADPPGLGHMVRCLEGLSVHSMERAALCSANCLL